MSSSQMICVAIMGLLAVFSINLTFRPVSTLRTIFSALANITIAVLYVVWAVVYDGVQHLIGEEVLPLTSAGAIAVVITLVMVLLGGLIVLGQGSAVAPFIYTLF